jgi:2-C-methyl-D-erythritol 4-phosphate cytidylyltransferase/2-C-methyl-D-erythritol 2,4-cyclodiphosphate synthase
MKLALIVVAAGRGTRAGGDLPKQWQSLLGRPVLAWTLACFEQIGAIAERVVVIHPDDRPLAAGLSDRGLHIVLGGAERQASVRAGLLALKDTDVTHVLIHDAARPCVSQQVIQAVIDALARGAGAAPALPVTDALWIGENETVAGVRDRAGLYRAQTPQGFDYHSILSAHENANDDAADDVAVARAAGLAVTIVPGETDNIKITGPDDFARAERYLRGDMDIRLGNGYDVHRFGDGDHVVLCGVQIPHMRSLQGHSDADVGMHAVTDAIYGALAEGDIGRHFPPSEAAWKGADSAIFLKHAVALARSKGYEIGNIDCTLVCEYPKIGPHADPMMARMAELMGLESDRVSIKATTSERLGFTGREEGIAALATATLVAR